MRTQLSASDLLSDASIIAGLRRAYEESGVGSNCPIEQGGFILVDMTAGTLEVSRLPSRGPDSLTFPICIDGIYEGKQIIGSFHTHPNIGPEWRQEPSRQDVRLSQDYPKTMGAHQFVLAKESIYHIDNDGAVLELGSTQHILRLKEDH